MGLMTDLVLKGARIFVNAGGTPAAAKGFFLSLYGSYPVLLSVRLSVSGYGGGNYRDYLAVVFKPVHVLFRIDRYVRYGGNNGSLLGFLRRSVLWLSLDIEHFAQQPEDKYQKH